MDHLQIISTISMACASLAIAGCGVCLALLLKWRANTNNCVAVMTQLDHELTEMSHDFDTVSRRAADQARRIAWLESRLRPNLTAAVPMASASEPSNIKLNITERRHRVLSLARRGQDAGTIAATLGIPRGEVELMINLSKAA